MLPPGFAPRDALFAIVGFALLWRTAGLVRAAVLLLITVLVLFGGARRRMKPSVGCPSHQRLRTCQGSKPVRRASEPAVGTSLLAAARLVVRRHGWRERFVVDC